MTSFNDIATIYIATWNERNAEHRRTLMDRHWHSEARYVDPLMSARGTEQLGEMIAAVQERFPDFHFALRGAVDGHGDHVRFSWGLGPEGAEAIIEGSDVVELSAGRLRDVVGFLDKVPAAA
uniref:nuclear transport factor 2 family protein n=1 Tax=uncultured Rhizobium sp. TaxID=155567 RepID=UPI00262A573D|nr:nuclear transport factor 2 family protein [uncultured Rhizobium sp.]